MIAAVETFVAIAKRWSSSELGQVPDIAYTAKAALLKHGASPLYERLSGDFKEIGTSAWPILAGDRTLRQVMLRAFIILIDTPNSTNRRDLRHRSPGIDRPLAAR